MSPIWVITAIAWLPVIPAALAYVLVGRRVWPVALGLLALAALGWGIAALGLRDPGLSLLALSVLAMPGVLGAALAPEFAEEETVAGVVCFSVSTLLTITYFAIRGDGTI